MMGTWGPGPFENDDAWDWFSSYRHRLDLEEINDMLRHIYNKTIDPNLQECHEALASIRIISILNGDIPKKNERELIEWSSSITFKPSKATLQIAKKALDRITQGSAARDAWEEVRKLDKLLSELSVLQNSLE